VNEGMSALPPKADICRRIEHVCYVPLADIETKKVNNGAQAPIGSVLGRVAASEMQRRLCSFRASRPLRNDQNTSQHDRRDHQRGEGTAQGKSTMVQGLVEEITQSSTKRSG
jgi:hypothetical protein